MDNKSPARAPWFTWVLAIVILASMYTYANYFDISSPDKTIEKFYQAYFAKDYDTVASNASVFWAVTLLPEKYGNMNPAELMKNRDKIEKDLSKTFAENEKNHPSPKDVKIKVLKDYTKQGEYAALVIYEFNNSGKTEGMEAAILLKEEDRFKVFTVTPVNEQNLEQIKNEDITKADEYFKKLLNTEE